jgi:DNA-binding SARP family transcriptional activator/Tfp pilus assembly protein PilF
LIIGALGRFEVRLLGPFVLRRDGVPIATAGWQKRVASVFKVIATGPNRRRTRDEIIDLLWPDASPHAGAGNLRLIVHLLRRALEISPDRPSPVRSERGWVGLNDAYDWEIDLERFEHVLQTAGDRIDVLEQAAALSGDAPLADDIYDDWAVPIRDRVQREWRSLCTRLADLHLDRGAMGKAAGWYERALDADPFDEEVLRRLLQVLTDLGRGAEALRRVRQFESLLLSELGVSASRETLDIAEQLRAALEAPAVSDSVHADEPVPPRMASILPSYPLPASTPLRGRQHELETILLVLSAGDLSPSRPANLVLVAGDAGMGKTRLLSEVARLATEAGLLVLAAGCYEEEGRLPYGPVHDALLDYLQAQPEVLLQSQLGPLLPLLAEIVPELRVRMPGLPDVQTNDPQAQRVRLYSTVAHTLQRMSTERSLVLLLDDLQWADEPTLQLLHFLLRQHGMQRILVAGTYRSDEAEPGSPLAQFATRALDAAITRVVPLAPLPPTDMTDLLEDRLGGECAPELSSALHERSAGNPFFSLQMVRLLEQEGSLQREHGRWTLAPGTQVSLPPAVRDTVARRLRHVTPEVRNTLALGSVLGREFEYVALETMADQSEDELFATLDAAHDAGLLRETGSGYAFTHPLLWEVVYGRVRDQRRRRLHDRAGLGLESLSGDGSADRAPELAWHFLESGNAPRALHYSFLAAVRAERVVAYAEAERHYRAAARLARSTHEQAREAETLEGLGRVLRFVGRTDQALDALEEAAGLYAALGDLDAEGRAVAQIGWTYYFSRRNSEGLDRLEPVVRKLEAAGTTHGLAHLYGPLPRVRGEVEGPAAELSAAAHAAELARAVDDDGLLGGAEMRRGRGLLDLGQLEEALEAFDQAIAPAERANDLFVLTALHHFAAIAYLQLGRLDDALRSAERAVEYAERRGGLDQLGSGVAHRFVQGALLTGAWTRAREYAERFSSMVQSQADPPSLAQPLDWMATLAVHEGQWDEAMRYVEELRATIRGADAHRLPPWLDRSVEMHRAQIELFKGNPGAALLQLDPSSADSLRDRDNAYRVLLAEAYLGVGSLAEAEEVLTEALHLIAEQQQAPRRIDALRVRGMLLDRQGRRSEAEDAFDDAATAARSMPYPYGEACALQEWGRLLAKRGQSEEARSRLREAVAIFTRLGARPRLEHAEQALDTLVSA